MGEGPLFWLFPRLFRAILNKEVSVKVCYVVVGNSVSWEVSVREVLHQSEETVGFVGQGFYLQEEANIRIWKPNHAGLFCKNSF